MYETQWANPELWRREAVAAPAFESRLKPAAVGLALHLEWEEHCNECAAPDCYAVCPLYRPRSDGRCVRLEYGVYRNPGFRGLYDFGADVRFRKWAKLEAELEHLGSAALAPDRFDAFVLECFSPETQAFRLVLECQQAIPADGARGPEYDVLLRRSFEIQPGANYFTVPFHDFPALRNGLQIRVYPEGDQQRRLIFTWLDFVRFESRPARSASKVKCVAWDLDQTLWSGVLSETADPTTLRLRPGVLEMLERLDERGIVQVVVSKNEYAEAWSVLDRLHVSGYFVQAAINWDPKSANLTALASRLTLGLDSFALIDDSGFERGEVRASCPEVRVFAETRLEELLKRPEFDVPITAQGPARRLSYLAENRREEIRGRFAGDHEEFLRSCELKLRIFAPHAGQELERCSELLGRSNKLNLSGRRYDAGELERLAADPSVQCLALECRDRFGDYGIVGLAILQQEGSVPVLTDFALSCRVARKKVEHAFLHWLVQSARSRGRSRLRVNWVDTGRNGLLRESLAEIPFLEQGGEGPIELDLTETPSRAPVLAVLAEV